MTNYFVKTITLHQSIHKTGAGEMEHHTVKKWIETELTFHFLCSSQRKSFPLSGTALTPSTLSEYLQEVGS